MALFKKNQPTTRILPSEPPKLPELPELSEFYSERDMDVNEPLPKLPSFPNNSFGEKISQNTIKKAITGREENNEDFNRFEGEDEPELESNSNWMMQKNTKKQLTRELPYMGKIMVRETEKIPSGFEEAEMHVRKIEPVFIRLDKFEESLHIFKKTKEKVMEIERMLNETKRIKEQEEKELEYWESETQKIKEEIEKIDKDVFSKVQ